MPIGLSTSCAWAAPQPDGPAGLLTPGALVDRVQRTGAVGLLLDDHLPPDYVSELMASLARCRGELPVWAVENVCPTSRRAAAELAALDRDEAAVAIGAAEETVRLAGELSGGDSGGGDGGALVLLRLGEVAAVRALWPAARRAFLRDELDGTQLAARLLRERDAHAARHLDALRQSLDRLSRAAEANGVRLGLRNPARPIGLPSPIELRLLLDELAGAPLAPALDLPAAHLGDAMALRPLAATLDAWKAAPLALVADACGPVVGLVPGRGELELAAALSTLSPDTRLVFVPSPRLDERELLEGAAALRALRP